MKRPNGAGGVRKLSGRRRKPYQAVITSGYVADENGNYKRKQVSIGTFRTKKEALLALSEWEMNSFDTDYSKMTFGDIVEIVLPQMTESKRKLMGAIIKKYEPIMKIKMKDIRKRDLDSVAEQFEGMSGSVQTRCKFLASRVFKYALENDICLRDYSRFMEFENTKERKDKTALTISEIEKVDSFEDKFWKIMLYSGMRISEAANMKREMIFEECGILCFHVENAKTKAGNRIIPVHSEIASCIDDVFPVNAGSTTLNRRFKQIGLSDHTTHDLRRTFATYGKKCGMDDFYRKALLGHAQTGVTDSVYTQVTVDKLKSEIEMLRYE